MATVTCDHWLKLTCDVAVDCGVVVGKLPFALIIDPHAVLLRVPHNPLVYGACGRIGINPKLKPTCNDAVVVIRYLPACTAECPGRCWDC